MDSLSIAQRRADRTVSACRYGWGISDPSDHSPVLASDAEREREIAVLRDAVAEGRLTLEEFSERVGRAQAARTAGELAVLVRDLPGSAAARPEPVPSTARHRAFCSMLVRKGPWELPQRSSFRSIFGTISLDLRQARLAAAEVELEIYNLFGTVTVIVPEGIVVNVEGGGLFATQVIDIPDVLAVADGPVLRIRVSGPGGTLYVRSREPKPKSVLGMLGVSRD